MAFKNAISSSVSDALFFLMDAFNTFSLSFADKFIVF